MKVDIQSIQNEKQLVEMLYEAKATVSVLTDLHETVQRAKVLLPHGMDAARRNLQDMTFTRPGRIRIGSGAGGNKVSRVETASQEVDPAMVEVAIKIVTSE